MRRIPLAAVLALAVLTGFSPILLGRAWADVTSTRIDKNEKIQIAIQEVFENVPGLTCDESDNWSVDGDLAAAADFLRAELNTRGWDVVNHGALEHSYAVVLDPDPSDERAVAIAGLIEETKTTSYVFLERCTLPEKS
jgi:hypothetical protein